MDFLHNCNCVNERFILMERIEEEEEEEEEKKGIHCYLDFRTYCVEVGSSLCR